MQQHVHARGRRGVHVVNQVFPDTAYQRFGLHPLGDVINTVWDLAAPITHLMFVGLL